MSIRNLARVLGMATGWRALSSLWPVQLRASGTSVPSQMTLPNFLVVGAGRAGTTSLHHYLRQHPDVFIPERKAPSHFYCVGASSGGRLERRLSTRTHFVADPVEYEALFDRWADEHAIGEVSPAYLASTGVAQRVVDRLEGVRIVAILRDPIERVHARYVARRRDGLERTHDFATLVDAELRQPLQLDDTAGTYLAGGFVSHVLQTYFDLIEPDRIRCYLFDDLVRDQRALVADLMEFIGVDPDVELDLGTAHNRSAGTIAGPIRRVVWTRTALARTWLRPHVPEHLRDGAFRIATRSICREAIDPAVRATLAELYRPEVERLATMLGRDLSHWCTAAGATSGLNGGAA